MSHSEHHCHCGGSKWLCAQRIPSLVSSLARTSHSLSKAPTVGRNRTATGPQPPLNAEEKNSDQVEINESYSAELVLPGCVDWPCASFPLLPELWLYLKMLFLEVLEHALGLHKYTSSICIKCSCSALSKTWLLIIGFTEWRRLRSWPDLREPLFSGSSMQCLLYPCQDLCFHLPMPHSFFHPQRSFHGQDDKLSCWVLSSFYSISSSDQSW